jgi:hypothetical protein
MIQSIRSGPEQACQEVLKLKTKFVAVPPAGTVNEP